MGLWFCLFNGETGRRARLVIDKQLHLIFSGKKSSRPGIQVKFDIGIMVSPVGDDRVGDLHGGAIARPACRKLCARCNLLCLRHQIDRFLLRGKCVRYGGRRIIAVHARRGHKLP